MKKLNAGIIMVLLVLAILNFSKLKGNEDIRPIQFISIWVIGALSALLIRHIFFIFETV